GGGDVAGLLERLLDLLAGVLRVPAASDDPLLASHLGDVAGGHAEDLPHLHRPVALAVEAEGLAACGFAVWCRHQRCASSRFRRRASQPSRTHASSARSRATMIWASVSRDAFARLCFGF